MKEFTKRMKANVAKKARNAVQAGKLIRPDRCEECNKTCVRKNGVSGINGHHPDYNKPLEVKWLCCQCHRTEHQRINLENELTKGEQLVFKNKHHWLPTLRESPFIKSGLLRDAETIDERDCFETKIDWNRYLGHLSYRQREVIRLRFGFEDGLFHTLQEVATIFKVTSEFIRQIEKQAVTILKRKMII